MIDFRNQLVTVVGLGRSGFESAKFLQRHGAKVFVTEKVNDTGLKQKKLELKSLGIQVELGSHDFAQILKSNLVIISPGISPKTEIYQKICQSKIPLWSEIELASRFCEASTIAVTGTNGKTTVTTLIAKLLSGQGARAVSCGNIGNPFIGEVGKLSKDDFVVVEVSSFQLENTEQFKPKVGVLLNLTDNHFDWHGTFENYANAKWKLFKNQTASDFAVLNRDDSESIRRSKSLLGKTIFFNSGKLNNPNFSACLSVVTALGFDVAKAEETLKNFQGIEHRMELVSSQDGFIYVNDSKSTTIASLKWALERMSKPAIVIAGGRHKGGDFKQIKATVREKVKHLVLIGEASREISNAFQDTTKIMIAANLKDAVQKARSVAMSGDTILFSPACASFDMFQNYQDRGFQYKQIVSQIQNGLVSASSPSV